MLNHYISHVLRGLGIAGLIAGTTLTAYAAPTWIVYDRGGHDVTSYVGDASDRLAVLFTPPSNPTQVLKVQIYTSRFAGAPFEDHNYRIVDASLTTQHFQATVPDGGSNWQEFDVESADVVVDGDFYVQWWPIAFPGNVGLGGDTEVGGVGLSWRSFYCPTPDNCSPNPEPRDYMIRVLVDDCGLFVQTVLGCDSPIIGKPGTGAFTVPVQVVDAEGPIVNCAIDQPLCEVDVTQTRNIDLASIAINLQTAQVSARLLDPTHSGFLAIEALTAVGSLPFEYTIQTDLDGDVIGDLVDNCPDWSNANQIDSDDNGIGNDCECGDQTENGIVTIADILAINNVIFEVEVASPLCDTNNDGRCDVADILGANAKIFGADAYCARYPSP